MRRGRAAGAVLLALAAPLGAQPAQPSPARGDEATLAPVTVTGEKSPSDLSRTYSGVSVLTGEDIDDLQVRDLRSTLRLLPNVNASPSNNGNNGIAIRGINSEGIGVPGANLRPLASVVVDGAPQSFEGVRRGLRGMWDMEQVEVFRGPQSTLQGRNSLAGAVILRTRDPTPRWEGALLAAIGEHDFRREAVMVSGPIGSPQLSFRIAAESQAEQYGIAYGDSRLQQLDDGEYRNARVKLLLRPDALPGFTLRFTRSDAFDRPAVTAISGPDFPARRLNQAAPGVENRENTVLSQVLEAELRPRPGVAVTALAAWTDTQVRFRTYTPAFVRRESRDDGDGTQELRVALTEGRLTGVAGVFAGRLRNQRDSIVQVRIGVLPPATLQNLESRSAIDNLGVYGEARWRATDRLTLIAGAREDRESTREDFTNRATRSSTSTPAAFRAFLPKGGVAYDLTPTQTVAFTVARGYRAGFTENGVSIAPEFLTSYEIAWRGRDARARWNANANLFYYDWTDQQVSVPSPVNPLATVTANAARSRAWGTEWQLSALAGRGLLLGASLGLLRTRLVEFSTATGNFSGRQFPEAPRASAAAWGVWRPGGGVFAAADWTVKSAFFATSDLANQHTLRVPGVGLVGVRAGVEAAHWSLVAGVTNLLDRNHLAGRDLLLGAYAGERRRGTLTFTARF